MGRVLVKETLRMRPSGIVGLVIADTRTSVCPEGNRAQSPVPEDVMAGKSADCVIQPCRAFVSLHSGRAAEQPDRRRRSEGNVTRR
jgi:hypothetical protein